MISKDLLAEFDAVMDDCLLVNGKKLGKIKEKLDKQKEKDPRSQRGHAERMKVIELYATMAEMEIPLDYLANEDKQYNAQVRFCSLMLEMNLFDIEDFKGE